METFDCPRPEGTRDIEEECFLTKVNDKRDKFNEAIVKSTKPRRDFELSS